MEKTKLADVPNVEEVKKTPDTMGVAMGTETHVEMPKIVSESSDVKVKEENLIKKDLAQSYGTVSAAPIEQKKDEGVSFNTPPKKTNNFKKNLRRLAAFVGVATTLTSLEAKAQTGGPNTQDLLASNSKNKTEAPAMIKNKAISGLDISDKFVKTNEVKEDGGMVIVKETPTEIVTAKGNHITLSEFEKANKNGMSWSSLKDYATWIDSWAHPLPPGFEKKIYLASSEVSSIKTISQEDLEYVKSKYPKLNNPYPQSNDSNALLRFGPDDSDIVRQILAGKPKAPKDTSVAADQVAMNK